MKKHLHWLFLVVSFFLGICYVSNLASSNILTPLNVYDVAESNILYVSLSGDDSHEGTSFSFAKRTLKAAITQANTEATSTNPITIQVGPGVFVEDNPLYISNNYVSVQGSSLNTTVFEPLNDGVPVFDMSANVGPATAASLNSFIIRGDTDFQTTAGSVGIKVTGDGLFLFQNIFIQNTYTGVSFGHGVINYPTISLLVLNDFGVRSSGTCIEGVGSGILLMNSVALGYCSTAVHVKDSVGAELYNWRTRGGPFSISGTGILIEDSASVTSVAGSIRNHENGISVENGSFNGTANMFDGNTNEVVQTGNGNISISGGVLDISKTSFFMPQNVKINSFDPNDNFIFTVGDGVKFGIRKADPQSLLHVYEDTSNTGNDVGITVENDGEGDSLIQFLLTTLQRWVIGIDNSDNDTFKISSSIDLNTDTHFSIQTNGNVGIGTATPQEKLEINNTLVFTSEFENSESGISPIVSWGNGNYQSIVLDSQNIDMQFQNPNGIGDFVLRIIQDPTGSRTVSTWDTDIYWENGVIPTLSITPNGSDILRCFFNGNSYFCNLQNGY